MFSSKILVAGLLLVIISAAALSLQLEWVYSTGLIFLAALFFAYAGGAPDSSSTLGVRRSDTEEQIGKEKHETRGEKLGHAHGE